MTAPRALLISLQKSGTHMMCELMAGLGYALHGAARIAKARDPVFDAKERRRMAELCYGDRAQWLALTGRLPTAQRLWDTLSWSWRIRLGVQLINRYDQQTVQAMIDPKALPRLTGSRFADTPDGICWIFHELDIVKMDGAFLREWAETGEPRLIFNHRDPRAVLLSFVNYLSGETKGGFGTFSDYKIYNQILKARGSLEEKLLYAIEDPGFPCWREFRGSQWMLKHPAVCRVSYEELVGPAGGGSKEAQEAAVTRLLAHLKAPGDPVSIAAAMGNRDTFTFFKGEAYRWREAFSPRVARAFERRHGDLLDAYVGSEEARLKTAS